MRKQFSFLLFLALMSGAVFSQEPAESKHKWGISAHIGANTVSTNSSHASFLNVNGSVGVLRHLRSENLSFDHHLKFKAQAFNEKLTNLPFYSLNENDELVSSTYTSKGLYSMIYVGWGISYPLPTKSNKLAIRGDAGFNYLLPARYVSTYSNGSPKGTQMYGRPFNFLLTRPEISVGMGYTLNMGKSELILAPFYSYNFTIHYLNLVPSFHTVGIETVLNF